MWTVKGGALGGLPLCLALPIDSSPGEWQIMAGATAAAKQSLLFGKKPACTHTHTACRAGQGRQADSADTGIDRDALPRIAIPRPMMAPIIAGPGGGLGP